jgi:hypothetical protein
VRMMFRPSAIYSYKVDFTPMSSTAVCTVPFTGQLARLIAATLPFKRLQHRRAGTVSLASASCKSYHRGEAMIRGRFSLRIRQRSSSGHIAR